MFWRCVLGMHLLNGELELGGPDIGQIHRSEVLYQGEL